MSPNIIARDIAEQHISLFNLKAFGINNIGQGIDENKVLKLNSKGQTNDKWRRNFEFLYESEGY